jgi:hypothetical protein
VLVNVNDMRKAKLPGDEGEMKRRIAYLEKLLAEAVDYARRNADKLALAEEEVRRASGLAGAEAMQKLKRIMPRRDKVRTMKGAWDAVAVEAAEVLKRYRQGLEGLTTGRNVARLVYPTSAQAAAVAMAAAGRIVRMPHMPTMRHR